MKLATFSALIWLLGLSGFACVEPAVGSQEGAPSGAAKNLTPELVLSRRLPGEVRLSPDQSRVAFTVTEPISGTDQNRDIWVHNLNTGESRRFTTSEKVDRHPRWSPDGDRLAFLSSRDGKPQIYLMRMDGGEAEALTESKTGVQSFEWSPSGRLLAFAAEEPKTDKEEEKEKKKDDAVVVDRDDRPARLWVIDVHSKEVRQLTSGSWRFSEYCWLGEDKLAVSATEEPQPELLTNRLWTVAVADGRMDELARPANPFGDLGVSADGGRLAYVGTRGDGPVSFDLFVLDTQTGSIRNLTSESIGRGIGEYQWLADGGLLVQSLEGFRTALHRVSPDGHAERLSDFDVDPSGSMAAGLKVLAFVGQTSTRQPELWVALGDAPARPVTTLNESWSGVAVVEPEVFQYSAQDGTPIEAALFLPSDRVEGAALPLVVQVHGGPTGRFSDRFDDWAQLLAAHGIAVLCPNIRGSVGYGHDFMTSNRRDWGGADFQDVLAGVDHLVEKGVADPDRVGIAGWSYGGYMAAWAVTRTDRFKASLSGAPMTDLEVEYGTETASINAYDTWFMGTPYDNQGLFVDRSPMTHVGRAKTPTLILCGDNDVIDPPGQCQQFYRGLRRMGVDATYVRYPREGHGIREEMHRLDLLGRVVSWFEEKLLGSTQGS